MKKFYLFLLASTLVLSGCVARTYPLTRDRMDQDLTGGNQGYIMGKSPAASSEGERKTTRTVRVFEIEFGKPYKTNAAAVSQPIQAQEAAPALETNESVKESMPEPAVTSSGFQKYTVGKNDTLQKISTKFYGTSKKWMKIYEANKDVLRGPDKVYPGQVLNIPELPKTKFEPEALKEPKENLK